MTPFELKLYFISFYCTFVSLIGETKHQPCRGVVNSHANSPLRSLLMLLCSLQNEANCSHKASLFSPASQSILNPPLLPSMSLVWSYQPTLEAKPVVPVAVAETSCFIQQPERYSRNASSLNSTDVSYMNQEEDEECVSSTSDWEYYEDSEEEDKGQKKEAMKASASVMLSNFGIPASLLTRKDLIESMR